MGAYDDKDRLEIVNYETLHFVKIFVNRIFYRSPHTHLDLEVSLVCAGKLRAVGNGLDASLEQGDILICNPKQLHEFQGVDGSARILVIQLSKEWLRFFAIGRIWFEENVLVKREHIELSSILLDLAQEYFSQKSANAFYCLQLVAATVHYLQSHIPYHFSLARDYLSDSNSERMGEILDFISKHFTEKITLDQLGRQFHLSPQYLSHLFRKNVGITFSKYIQMLRFEKAVNLIDSTDIRLTDICVECGFSDYKYMEKLFLGILGYTPKQYRQHNKPSAKRSYSQNNEYIYSNSEALEFLNKIKETISAL